jgi:type IV fimbrial biogenesis protein FimT
MLSRILIAMPFPISLACGPIKSSRPSHHKAFTIIELLSTVTILAISISVAVPSFNALLENTKLKTTAQELNSTLMHARNYAISNRVMVIVCQADGANYEKCSPRRKRYENWQNGWISYADLNKNNELDRSDKVLFAHQANSQTAVVFNQIGRLRFFPMGSARSAGFYMCSSSSSKTRYIRLLHTGRSRISQELSKKQLSKCLNQIKN